MTQPTEQESALFRAAAWVEGNELTVASITKQAEDLRTQMKAVARASADPKGLRVAQMRHQHARLLDLFSRLDALPPE